MALVYTEEEQLLRDSAKEFLEERCSVSAFRALRDTGNIDGFDREVWSQMAELGWPGILVSEEHDGLEFGVVGAGVIFEEMGRTLACSPLLSTAITGAVLLMEGGNDAQKQTFLPAIAAGEKLTALAVDEGPRHAPRAVAMRAEPTNSGYSLSGSKQFVIDGRVADTLIVVARTSGEPGDDAGLTLFLVDADAEGVTVTPNQMIDFRSADNVNFANVQITADAVLGKFDQGAALLEIALNAANRMLAAELLGIAEEAFGRTVAYMKERKQFGVPIGSFQALQHRAAQVYTDIELTRSVVLKALQSEGPAVPMLTSLAKAKACATAQLATNESIQMHGGIGMTDEYEIGFFIKRARVAQHTYGDYTYHADRVARMKGY